MRKGPPSGPGLPDSRRRRFKQDRDRKKHPGKRGPLSLQDTEALVRAATEGVLEGKTPAEIGAAAGRGVESKAAREIVLAARERLARGAERFVEALEVAAATAAAEGDAKPAIWALEHIAVDDARVVDAEKAAPAAPTAHFNILLGGITPAQAQVTSAPAPAAALPAAVEGETVPEELMP